MKCISCGGSFHEKRGDLRLPDAILGELVIRNVKYFRCSSCDEILMPPRTVTEIEQIRDRRIGAIIDGMPIREFITPAKAAKLLGITRQAFHKNRSIRNGMIYSTDITSNRMFVRESVIRFKERGDGRFPLQTGAMGEIIPFTRQVDSMLFHTIWDKPIETVAMSMPVYTSSRGVNAHGREN